MKNPTVPIDYSPAQSATHSDRKFNGHGSRESSNAGLRAADKDDRGDERGEEYNEQSPLLAPATGDAVGSFPSLNTSLSPDESGDNSPWHVDADVQEEDKSTWYLFFLTLAIGG